jgi:hypothetical protein
MVIFDASNPTAGTEYHDVVIDDPVLTDYGFTKFKLPLNGNAIKMILYNDKDPSMITYVDFDKHNLDKSVKLHDKLVDEQQVESKAGKDTVEGMVAYFRNRCISLQEDPSNEFFKNGNEKSNESKSNQNNKCLKLELELTPKLNEAAIVDRFTFYRQTNSVCVLLNHAYDRKSIIFTIDNSNWNKTIDIFKKRLKQKGIINQEHILLLLDVLDDNYESILELSSSSPSRPYNGNSSSNSNSTAAIATEEVVNDDTTITTTVTTNTGANITIDPSKDLDPYIPDRDYVEFTIKTAKKTVKQEDSLVRQIVYTGLTKDSTNPQNLAILAPTSEGKTHAALETLEYFPEVDLWKLGSMSPKVIIRQNGILVNNKYEPIDAQLEELKKQIRVCRKEEADEQAEELEEQKHQLLQEAKVMIDLRGKLLVFLEPPHPETWNILKPILSHDSHYIEHPYVYHVEDFGFRVKKIVTRGWPACIFCSARNESKWPQWPEIQSRFLITSPNMIQQKYREGIKLSAQRKGLPRLAQQSMIISDTDIELAKKCILHLVSQMKRFLNDEFNPCPVWQPYASILGSALPGEKGTDNRIANRIFDFINIVALSHAHLRYKLKYGNETLVQL